MSLNRLLRVDVDSLSADRRTLALVLPVCREVKRRFEHPYYHFNPDDHPDRNQVGFLQSRKRNRAIFGGTQSGKSKAVAYDLVLQLLEEHPFRENRRAPRVYVVSAFNRTIQEGIYRHLRQFLPDWMIDKEGQRISGWDIPQYIRVKKGGQIDFISGEGREEARRKLAAAEIDVAVVDEEVDESLIDELQSRRLARDGDLIVSAALIRSETWCLELEDRAETGDPDIDLFRFSTYRAAEAGHVSKAQIREMEATMTKEDLDVRLRGHSRRHEGLIYPEFGKAHIVEPFEIPKTWTRYCALDPGWRTFGVLWIAVGPGDKYVIYREFYYHGAKCIDVAEQILAAEGYKRIPNSITWAWDDQSEQMSIRWIDPKAFGHHETGEVKVGTLMAIYSQELGVGSRLACVPARNEVMTGIEFCRRSLHKDMDGVPKMRVFSTCRNFIMEARSYRWTRDSRDSNKSESRDVPIKRRDHLLDAWRYLEAGGLNYEGDRDRMFDRRSQDDDYPFRFTEGMDERRQEHWKRLMARQRGELQETAQHPGGLGSEY